MDIWTVFIIVGIIHAILFFICSVHIFEDFVTPKLTKIFALLIGLVIPIIGPMIGYGMMSEYNELPSHGSEPSGSGVSYTDGGGGCDSGGGGCD